MSIRSFSKRTKRFLAFWLEYIVPSITLRQFFLEANPPYHPGLVASVCDDAMRLVNMISDFEALNKDARLDNVLVRQSILDLDVASKEEHIGKTCVAIDLSHVIFRG